MWSTFGAKGTLFANGFTTLDQKACLSFEPVRKIYSALDGWDRVDVARGKVTMEISCKYQQSQRLKKGTLVFLARVL